MLTGAQLSTLKADIATNFPGTPTDSDGNTLIANAYNLTATPDYWVWRTRVAKSEFTTSVSVDGTTFSWAGSGFITRSVGERDAWRDIFDGEGFCDPSLANIRQAFTDIFSGATAPAPANRTHLSTVARRKATRGEKLLATGAGTTGAPSVMGFEGQLSYDDIDRARNS